MRRLVTICVVSGLLAVSGSVSADIDLTDLSGYVLETRFDPDRYVYNYDIPAGADDIIMMSFDYSYGDQSLPFGKSVDGVGYAAFRIRQLKDDGTDGWLASFNIHPGSYNLLTDYDASVSSGALPSGVNHYEFTMNRSNGEWDLALNGTPGVLVGPAATGGARWFTDESPEAIQNAIDLGYAGTPLEIWGLGGTGAYRLQFEEALNGSVNNIEVTAVPVPAAVLLGMLGLSVAGVKLRRLV